MAENIVPTRVLIVEDSKVHRKQFQEVVEGLGYSTVPAANLQEALACLNRLSFPVALIDLRLDEEDLNNWDGFKVVERVRDIGEGTAIIVLTAFGEVEHTEEAFLKYKVKRFIRKQKVDWDEVEDEIRQAVNEYDLDKVRQIWEEKSLITYLKGPPIVEIQRALRFGKIGELERFLKRSFYHWYPLLSDKDNGKIVALEGNLQALEVRLWSKALGRPLLIKVGNPEAMQAWMKQVEALEETLREAGYRRKIQEVFDERHLPHLGGAIYELTEAKFEEFETPEYPEPVGWKPKKTTSSMV